MVVVPKLKKPPERKGFWNKIKGVIKPTDEEIHYRRQKQLSVKKHKAEMARLDKEIKTNRGRARGILDNTPGMLDFDTPSERSKKKKPRDPCAFY